MDYKPWELQLNKIWRSKVKSFNIKDTLLIPYKMLLAFKIAKLDTYYPEYERKGYWQRVIDNIVWALVNKEPNIYYTSYGLDVKNFHEPKDYMAYREFKLARDGALYLYPEKYRFSYQILVRDKYIFSCYLSNAVGSHAVPKTIAVIQDNTVIVEPTKENQTVEQFFSDNKKVICKIIDGECADSVLLLTVKDNQITNGKDSITINKLKKIFTGKRYLVQEVVVQHDDVNYLNPYCVNTIRIITVRGKSGVINVLAASIRISARRDSFVDNRAAGGMAVGINNDGTLMKYGFQHTEFGGRNEKHPITGVVFEGYQLPYWSEVVELVKASHKAIIGLQSIGWDVAITPNGPILIEGNDNWEIANPQDAIGGLKKKWYELVNS